MNVIYIELQRQLNFEFTRPIGPVGRTVLTDIVKIGVKEPMRMGFH